VIQNNGEKTSIPFEPYYYLNELGYARLIELVLNCFLRVCGHSVHILLSGSRPLGGLYG
jgi:hypothetical protein